MTFTHARDPNRWMVLVTCNDLLQETLKSDVPSISAQFAVPIEQLEGLVGNYRAAFARGVTQMFLVAALVFIPVIGLLRFGFNPKAQPDDDRWPNWVART